MSFMQCWCQVALQAATTDASAVEVINCVYQKSHNYKTTPSPACMLAGCTALSIAQAATNTMTVQPRTTVNRLHARSAMYLSDQPSWWFRPVTHVQLAGHVSTTDIWWRSIHGRLGHIPTVITAAVTSVLTQLLKSQLGRVINIGRFFISLKSVVELCRVQNFTTVGMCRVWCAPNESRLWWLRLTDRAPCMYALLIIKVQRHTMQPTFSICIFFLPISRLKFRIYTIWELFGTVVSSWPTSQGHKPWEWTKNAVWNFFGAVFFSGSMFSAYLLSL